MLRSVHHNGLHRVAAQVDVVLVRPAAFTFITSVSRLRAGFSLHFPVNGLSAAHTVPLARQMSSDVLRIQQGSLYPALHRLERRGLIKAHWGKSENNRRAKYYELSKNGRNQLEVETDAWAKLTAAVAQVLGTA